MNRYWRSAQKPGTEPVGNGVDNSIYIVAQDAVHVVERRKKPNIISRKGSTLRGGGRPSRDDPSHFDGEHLLVPCQKKAEDEMMLSDAANPTSTDFYYILKDFRTPSIDPSGLATEENEISSSSSSWRLQASSDEVVDSLAESEEMPEMTSSQKSLADVSTDRIDVPKHDDDDSTTPDPMTSACDFVKPDESRAGETVQVSSATLNKVEADHGSSCDESNTNSAGHKFPNLNPGNSVKLGNTEPATQKKLENINIFRCGTCAILFSTKELCLEHIYVVHKADPMRTQCDLRRTDEKRFMCHVCATTFDSLDGFRKHKHDSVDPLGLNLVDRTAIVSSTIHAPTIPIGTCCSKKKVSDVASRPSSNPPAGNNSNDQIPVGTRVTQFPENARPVDTRVTQIPEITTPVDTKVIQAPEISTQVDTRVTQVPEITAPVDTRVTRIPENVRPVDNEVTQVPEVTTPVDTKVSQIPEMSTPVDTKVTKIPTPADTTLAQIPEISTPVHTKVTQVPEVTTPVDTKVSQIPEMSAPVDTNLTPITKLVDTKVTQIPNNTTPVESKVTFPENLDCFQCEKTFASLYYYLVHGLVHTNREAGKSPLWDCQICQENFPGKPQILEHFRIHCEIAVMEDTTNSKNGAVVTTCTKKSRTLPRSLKVAAAKRTRNSIGSEILARDLKKHCKLVNNSKSVVKRREKSRGRNKLRSGKRDALRNTRGKSRVPTLNDLKGTRLSSNLSRPPDSSPERNGRISNRNRSAVRRSTKIVEFEDLGNEKSVKRRRKGLRKSADRKSELSLPAILPDSKAAASSRRRCLRNAHVGRGKNENLNQKFSLASKIEEPNVPSESRGRVKLKGKSVGSLSVQEPQQSAPAPTRRKRSELKLVNVEDHQCSEQQQPVVLVKVEPIENHRLARRRGRKSCSTVRELLPEDGPQFESTPVKVHEGQGTKRKRGRGAFGTSELSSPETRQRVEQSFVEIFKRVKNNPSSCSISQ